MALIAQGVLSNRINELRKTKEAFRSEVQDVLVTVAYQAAMGNPNYANELLEAVRDTLHIKPLTMWLETFAPLVIRKDAFVINKGMAKTMAVTCEADFAQYESDMRKVNWWDMCAPQKASSIFDAGSYIESAFTRMAKELNKNGQPDLANEVAGLIKTLYGTEAWKAATHKEDETVAA